MANELMVWTGYWPMLAAVGVVVVNVVRQVWRVAK